MNKMFQYSCAMDIRGGQTKYVRKRCQPKTSCMYRMQGISCLDADGLKGDICYHCCHTSLCNRHSPIGKPYNIDNYTSIENAAF